MLNREVGDANAAGLALGKLGHGFFDMLISKCPAPSASNWDGILTLPGVRD